MTADPTVYYHTFAALIAGRDNDGNAHNTNVDIVVVHTVGVPNVERPTLTIDTVGTPKDKDNFEIPTFKTIASEVVVSPEDGITLGGTTFKAERRPEVTSCGAKKAPTTDGRTLYLSSTEIPIDEGVGITAAGDRHEHPRKRQSPRRKHSRLPLYPYNTGQRSNPVR